MKKLNGFQILILVINFNSCIQKQNIKRRVLKKEIIPYESKINYKNNYYDKLKNYKYFKILKHFAKFGLLQNAFCISNAQNSLLRTQNGFDINNNQLRISGNGFTIDDSNMLYTINFESSVSDNPLIYKIHPISGSIDWGNFYCQNNCSTSTEFNFVQKIIYTTDNHILAISDKNILKLNPLDGSIVWSLNINLNTNLTDIKQYKNNSFIVITGSTSDITLKHEIFVSRINFNGSLIWGNLYDITNENTTFASNSITILNDNEIIIGGNIFGLIHFTITRSAFLMKLNSSGSIIWTNIYKIFNQTSRSFFLQSVKNLDNKSIIIFGGAFTVFDPDIKYFSKINTTLGDIFWTKVFNYNDSRSIGNENDLAISSDKSINIITSTFSLSTLFLFKFNSTNSEFIWSQFLNGPYRGSQIITKNDSIYVYGSLSRGTYFLKIPDSNIGNSECLENGFIIDQFIDIFFIDIKDLITVIPFSNITTDNIIFESQNITNTNITCEIPTINPTSFTMSPYFNSTSFPSQIPTLNPINIPTTNPSANPTNIPTNNPSFNPTNIPSTNPSTNTSYNPTNIPSVNPSFFPITNPTLIPSVNPTNNHTQNSTLITGSPTYNPTNFDLINTSNPSTSSSTINPTSEVSSSENESGELSYILPISIIVLLIIVCCCLYLLYRFYKKYNLEKSLIKYYENVTETEL